MNDLLRLPIADREGGAQCFMAVHDFRNRRTQRCDVESSAETHRERNVVGRRVGIQLMDEPQPLLRVREWRPSRFSVDAAHRRDVLTKSVSAEGFNIGGQLIHGWMLKERAYRQFHMQCLAHT